MTFKTNRWYPASALSSTRFYPYMVKPDILSSNSFIIESDRQVILIDPGGLQSQWEGLTDILTPVITAKPLVIYLTHCHVDHCLAAGLSRSMKQITTVQIAIQENGAGALSRGDTRMTMADLYGYDFPAYPPDFLLLPDSSARGSHDVVNTVPRLDAPVEDLGLSRHTARTFRRQRIDVGGNDTFEAYHTPGHSPDSICLRFNDWLFISDLLSAVNPLVAGGAGWNRQHYMDSLLNVMWLINDQNIQHCFPGHGVPLPREEALEKLSRAYDTVTGLGKLDRVDREKVLDTKAYAIDLLAEVGDVFTVLSGRLYALAYHLETLEEHQEAKKYQNLLDADKIEHHITGFNAIIEQVQNGNRLDLHLIFKAVGAVRNIMKLFDQRRYEAVISQSHLRRASDLLKDFLAVIRGVPPRTEKEEVCLNSFVKDLVRNIQICRYKDESIFDTLHNNTAFLEALSARIAHVPIFQGIHIKFFPGRDCVKVRLDRQRFSDALQGLLEHIALTKGKQISVSTYADQNETGIKLLTDRFNQDAIIARKFNIHVRRFRICGCRLVRVHTPEEQGFSLIFTDVKHKNIDH